MANCNTYDSVFTVKINEQIPDLKVLVRAISCCIGQTTLQVDMSSLNQSKFGEQGKSLVEHAEMNCNSPESSIA